MSFLINCLGRTVLRLIFFLSPWRKFLVLPLEVSALSMSITTSDETLFPTAGFDAWRSAEERNRVECRLAMGGGQ
jgi:hypothetical protein